MRRFRDGRNNHNINYLLYNRTINFNFKGEKIMLTTETLEEMLKDLRKSLNMYKPHERQQLLAYYQGKFDVLEDLIDISKEADK